MRIGVNFSARAAYPCIESLIQNEEIDFVELLVDNFLQCDPKEIRSIFKGLPIGFHIMQSRILERSLSELSDMGREIKKLIKELEPVYISDHIAHFSLDGRDSPRMIEVDYEQVLEKDLEKFEAWQDYLGERIYFENFPSHSSSAFIQPNFFKELISSTGVGLLFDHSNALVAEKNGALPAVHWNEILVEAPHRHLGGYSFSDTSPSLALDSHSEAVSSECFEQITQTVNLGATTPKTIIVERDFQFSLQEWRDDIAKLREIYAC